MINVPAWKSRRPLILQKLNKPGSGVMPALGRRSMLSSLGATGVLSLAMPVPRALSAATATVFDVTQQPYNADQSGQNDASGAFQSVFQAISSLGRGVLLVPAGEYLLNSPVTCDNASLTIYGAGQASSVLKVRHTGAAITVNCNSQYQSVSAYDIGFSPIPPSGGPAGCALALEFPNADSGWQKLALQDIDLGVARPGYTTFSTGIRLTNAWRGSIRNVNMHSNIGSVPGTSFVSLNGFCIDNRIATCNVDGIDLAVAVNSYSEGLHLNDSVFIGNTGLSTGYAPYSGNGSSSPFINLLGLYISGCEFNCRYKSLQLAFVDTGWVLSTHFSTYTPGLAAVSLQGCSLVQFGDCSMTGNFKASAPLLYYGVYVGTEDGWSSNGNSFDNLTLTNLSTGLVYGPSVRNNTATGLRMFGPSNASLVNTPLQFGNIAVQPCLDISGNATNVAGWISSSSGMAARSARVHYTQ